MQNMKIYDNHLKNSKAHKFFMDQISTDYIRAYKGGQTKLDSPQEKTVITKLIEFFSGEVQEFRRCAQLQRISKGEMLSEKYVF